MTRCRVDDSRSSLRRLHSDAVTKSLTSSLCKSRGHHFILVTPSPRSVCVVLQDTWCGVVVLNGIDFLKSKSEFKVVSYFDSDWAKCLKTRRLVSSYCVFVNGFLVSWKSKKQSTLYRSSTEAEYMEMDSATCEVMRKLKILKDLGLDNLTPITLFCHNKSAIQIAVNHVMHVKTKHFDIDVHLVREKVASGLLKIKKVDSKEQVADILTKALDLHGLCNKNEFSYGCFSKKTITW
nr:ribonuclease H-like domain-containing protein [Tanacetum cinerariifolium]